MARLADEMKVARLAVGMFEAKATLAKIDLARDPGLHHPLQRAVDGGPADTLILATNEIDQIVGTEVPFLPQEDVNDLFSLTGPLAA